MQGSIHVRYVPEGAVKHVIDALIDALNTNLNKGLSVQLGDFGCFRPGMSCKSQKEEKDVDADTVGRVKIVFTPGYKFKDMLDNVSIYKNGRKRRHLFRKRRGK